MIRRLLPSALLLALLSGCSILPKSEVLDVYVLPAQRMLAAPEQASVALSLRVNQPHANPLLYSTRIAVIPADNRISVYQGARWSDRAPLLLRDRLVDAFRDDGRLKVSSDESRLLADLELDSDLRAFHSEYQNGMPAVRILLEARLVESGNRRILASRRFEINQTASDTSLTAVVEAFGQAGDQLARDVLEWAMSQPQGVQQR
jgi:cholesterol transport system auxiliary component